MTSLNHTSTDLITQADHIQQFIESMVANGSDQELFISAYVNGHFDLAVARCLERSDNNVSMLDEYMRSSLAQAKNELSHDDFNQAMQFWQRCIEQVTG